MKTTTTTKKSTKVFAEHFIDKPVELDIPERKTHETNRISLFACKLR